MTSKADRFIVLLDAARCNGDWQAVPEIIRKLNKHALHRKCLIESARAESSIALSTKHNGRNVAVDPQRFIPALSAAVQSEKKHVEDILQARVCLIWLHWTVGELSGVQSHSPWDLIQDHLRGEEERYSGWTKVSIIKGIYIIGNTYERRSLQSEAFRTYASALPLISRTLSSSIGLEFEAWTERLLAAYCLLSSEAVVSNLDDAAIRTVLVGFRLWTQLWASYANHNSTSIGGNIVGTSRPRRQIWELYHSLLSTILQHDLLYPPSTANNRRSSPASDSTEQEESGIASSRLRAQQRAELQFAQETYERLLLAEIPFPRANEHNKEIERWANVVMGNWRIFCCGNRWDERELSEGGKDSCATSVLDILYRAAAKSFHSTSILRHLFTVHAFLDEFDLAIKALETYIELVKKGKSRALKSGQAEPNLDEDEIVLQATSEGVKYLCCHTGERAAVRAKEIGTLIETWLEESENPEKALAEAKANGVVTAGEEVMISNRRLSNTILASGYRAVGISKAHWSRTTYDAKPREDMRKEALLSLQKSLCAQYEDTENPQSLFALGLLSAESREIDKAVVAVKHALLRQARALKATSLELSESHSPQLRPPLTSTTKNLPLWHLLVLLLSAAQEFDTALDTCEAVIGQFDDALEWKEENDANGLVKAAEPVSSSLPQTAPKPSPDQSRELLNKLESQEKEALLQIKMTHLALIEVTEDSEAAVNASDELLQLYSTLYGGSAELKFRPRPVLPVSTKPSRISSGTLRSIRESLFGKSKSTRRSLRHIKSSFALGDTHTSFAEHASGLREGHGPQKRPQIQVVNEYNQVTNSIGHEARRHLTVQTVGRSQSRKLHKRNRSLNRTIGPSTFGSKKKVGSTSSDAGYEPRPLSVNSSIISGASGELTSHAHNAPQSEDARYFREPRPCNSNDQVSQAGLSMTHEMPSTNERQPHGNRPVSREHAGRENPPGSGSERPQSHEMRLISNDHALGAGNRPSRRRLDDRRYSLLVRVWLFISGLYRRGALYGDANGAIEEASRVLESLEIESTTESSMFSPPSVNDQSIARTIDELRADLLTERGYLAQAQSLHQDALGYFEQAVSYCIDHPLATVGLCSSLLDYSSGTTSHRSSHSPLSPDDPASSFISVPNYTAPTSTSNHPPSSLDNSSEGGKATTHPDSFVELDRLAARDRAYGLLISLTKLAAGWDLSSAWFELSRVYEQSGQMEKAREALWRCVELEDRKPIRHWRNAETRGYVL